MELGSSPPFTPWLTSAQPPGKKMSERRLTRCARQENRSAQCHRGGGQAGSSLRLLTLAPLVEVFATVVDLSWRPRELQAVHAVVVARVAVVHAVVWLSGRV